jgi:hypothetical protein
MIETRFYEFHSERDRELYDFYTRFSAKLDKEIAGHEIEWSQKALSKYQSEFREAKSCEQRGDTFTALGHYLLADMLRDFLKRLNG